MRETWVQSLGQKIPWRRKWQLTPGFLPGESPGQRSLVGYSPWDRKEWDSSEHNSDSTKVILKERQHACVYLFVHNMSKPTVIDLLTTHLLQQTPQSPTRVQSLWPTWSLMANRTHEQWWYQFQTETVKSIRNPSLFPPAMAVPVAVCPTYAAVCPWDLIQQTAFTTFCVIALICVVCILWARHKVLLCQISVT